MKKVYVAMSADFIHPGHLKVIKKSSELGDVVVGVLTDKAIASYKRLPLLTLSQRIEIIKNVKGVSEVIEQSTLDYTDNLEKTKPDYVVHGDDWVTGPQFSTRAKVIAKLKEWGGELVEVPYTQELSSSKLTNELRMKGITPELRRASLKRLLAAKPLIRVIEVHNGLTGLIAEDTEVQVGGETRSFDAMWESSLTDSTSKGKPDTSAVDVTSRVNTIDQIMEVTTKPMIVDADNGGMPEHFVYTVKTLERFGVSAVIIEDKVGFKRNSLFGTDVKQTQDTVEAFSHKISLGKKTQVTDDFMIIARVESLVLKQGMKDALTRAEAYINAGADGIMIHSKEKTSDEILEFCRGYKEFGNGVPLVVVPSTYSTISEEELIEAGISVVIYANHLLRSAFPAMVATAKSILKNSRCEEASRDFCMPIKEILTLIPETLS